MSDPADTRPPPEGGPSRNDDAADFSEGPREPSGSGFPAGPKLPATSARASRWREQAAGWLEKTLARKSGVEDPFYLKTVLPVMDRLAGIGASLAAMIIVDRQYGPAGLGIFAWFFSLLAITGYLGRYGIPIYLAVNPWNKRRPSRTNCLFGIQW